MDKIPVMNKKEEHRRPGVIYDTLKRERWVTSRNSSIRTLITFPEHLPTTSVTLRVPDRGPLHGPPTEKCRIRESRGSTLRHPLLGRGCWTGGEVPRPLTESISHASSLGPGRRTLRIGTLGRPRGPKGRTDRVDKSFHRGPNPCLISVRVIWW